MCLPFGNPGTLSCDTGSGPAPSSGTQSKTGSFNSTVNNNPVNSLNTGASTPAAGGVQTTIPKNPNAPVQTTIQNPTNTSTNVTLINPLKGGGNLETFLLNILDFVIRIGTIFVILMLVYVGFLFVKAQGEPAEITKARAALLWTVVGALILLGSKAIAIAIGATVTALGG